MLFSKFKELYLTNLLLSYMIDIYISNIPKGE